MLKQGKSPLYLQDQMLQEITDQNSPTSHTILLGEFRERAEDKVTHRYQNPWQPPPAVLNRLRDGRAFLAWPLKRSREGRESAQWKVTTLSPIHNTDSSTSNEMLDCEPLPPCEEGAAIPFNSNEHVAGSP
ncbi:uncharacterized protein LOC132391577 isoform X2 [Hypanus sabinus]|uniref:uncharacterized protein LOC132391577 isoform X2 n=1 Tax=Hypanus sabinus TaxID=79690 RepID=UPI0028C45AA8|nr:uncharacterized protein LOC132391577 isoform X2 [Hypanus sabinus]